MKANVWKQSYQQPGYAVHKQVETCLVYWCGATLSLFMSSDFFLCTLTLATLRRRMARVGSKDSPPPPHGSQRPSACIPACWCTVDNRRTQTFMSLFGNSYWSHCPHLSLFHWWHLGHTSQVKEVRQSAMGLFNVLLLRCPNLNVCFRLLYKYMYTSDIKCNMLPVGILSFGKPTNKCFWRPQILMTPLCYKSLW